MTIVSLTKNRLVNSSLRVSMRISAALFSIFLMAPSASIAASVPLSFFYSGDFSGRLAEHLYQPIDLASQKFTGEMNESVKWNNWSGNFGLRAWDEGAYASTGIRYPDQVVKNDTSDIRLRDFYLQYKDDGFTLKLGNQQVVWGEAFGFFYSDIINPKDFRDGAFGNPTDTRLQTPMANAKVVAGNFSIQGILVPQPFFSILPEPGSNFLFPYGSYSPFPSITVQRQNSLPLETKNMEYGGRISYLFGNLDLSAFYFNYFDRLPYYSLNPASTQSNLVVDEQHSRIQSGGITATAELGEFLFRFEGLTTLNRNVASLAASELTAIATNQYVYVVGIDFPTIEKFNLGFQWSQDVLETDADYLTRNSIQNLVSVHFQRPFFLKQNFQLIYTYELSDGGSRLEASYTIPLSGSVESSFGVNLLTGPGKSDFGRDQEGSRAFASLKCYFKG